MKCPECLNDDTTIDEYSDTCYCPKCHRMYRVKLEVKRDVIFPVCVLVGLLTLIPIVNIPVILILQKFNIKDEYMRMYCINVLITLMAIFSIFGFIVYRGYSIRDASIEYAQERIDSLLLDILKQQEVNRNKETELANRKILDDLKKQEEAYDTELHNLDNVMSEDDMSYLEKVTMYLDKTTMSGEQVLKLINDCEGIEDSIILLQTNALRDKYGEYYKIYNRLPACSISLGDDLKWYLDVTRKVSFYNFDTTPMVDEFGNKVTASYDNFNKSNYIWNIKSKSKFQCMVRIEDDTVIFGFREVKEDDA